MNGMLPDHDVSRALVERQHLEAREWARSDALGRLSRMVSEPASERPVRTRLLGITTPLVAVLALVVTGVTL